jgi:hypothetical protein
MPRQVGQGRGKQFTDVRYANDFSQKILVEGLYEFLAQVKATAPEVAKEVSNVNKRAADIVKDTAKAKAAGLGGVANKAAGSLATSKSTRLSSVRLGRGMPFAFGAEFGAKHYPQFKPWRGNQWVSGEGPATGVGYFLYPAIRDERAKIETEYMAAMLALMRMAGFRVSDTGESL